MSDLDTLIDAARAAAEHAYAPYSHFRVGAAARTADGRVFTGCNVENASYGATICAERNAIFQMVAAGARRLDTLVIYTATNTPAAPCGICRQVMAEFGPQARVVSVCDSDTRLDRTVAELLPDAFGPGDLSHDPLENA